MGGKGRGLAILQQYFLQSKRKQSRKDRSNNTEVQHQKTQDMITFEVHWLHPDAKSDLRGTCSRTTKVDDDDDDDETMG